MEMTRPQYTIRTLLLVTLAVGVVLTCWRFANSIVPTLDQPTLDLWLAFIGLASIVLMVGFAGWWAINQ